LNFEKASDKAHPGLMLKTLGEYEVSGQFYDVMVALVNRSSDGGMSEWGARGTF
jgi:hypothetical protein